jgi:hypothetical protein
MEAREDRWGSRTENCHSPLVIFIHQTFKRQFKTFSHHIDSDSLICEKSEHPGVLSRYRTVAPFQELMTNAP